MKPMKGDLVIDMKSIPSGDKHSFIKAIKDKSYKTGIINKISAGYAYVRFDSKPGQLIPVELMSLKKVKDSKVWLDDAFDQFKELTEMKLAQQLLNLLSESIVGKILNAQLQIKKWVPVKIVKELPDFGVSKMYEVEVLIDVQKKGNHPGFKKGEKIEISDVELDK